MDEKLSKVNDESMKEVTGGAYRPNETRKFNVGDRVKCLSRPELGVGVVIDLGSLSGSNACAVAFDKTGEVLPENDLALAD